MLNCPQRMRSFGAEQLLSASKRKAAILLMLVVGNDRPGSTPEQLRGRQKNCDPGFRVHTEDSISSRTYSGAVSSVCTSSLGLRGF
jgi:hypothetical protein